MEMLLSLVFWMIALCTDAVYVNRLNGTIYLPSADTDTCTSSYRCPLPTNRFDSSPLGMIFTKQNEIMKCDWFRHQQYVYPGVALDRYSEIIGSQIDCDMETNGRFTCTLPDSHCYAFVRLGFRAKPDSKVVVHKTTGRSDVFLGTNSVQIVGLGTSRRGLSSVHVELECINNDQCLETQTAVLEFLYKC